DNIRSFGLFPNPANGHFVVSFEAKKPVKQVRITLTNVLGQAVQQAQFAEGGASFFREIPLRDIPKGIYSVAVEADGERLVRRLLVE
ncbi:MAG: T9SS type A sorting domain-containing protein, partial [Bacteroidetes bacterium]|nr:T9SS type A sorting domain-containing protein [Bacteroidota bacterium]